MAFHHTQNKAVCIVEVELDQQIELLQRDSTLQVVLCGEKAPTRGSELAAGLDLYAYGDHTIPAKGRAPIRTGVAIKLLPGTYGRVASRSGLAFKQGIDVKAGVIDRDYTGEIRVLLANSLDVEAQIKDGDRIAQLIVERIANVDVEIVDSLEETARGTQGFGSTGT